MPDLRATGQRRPAGYYPEPRERGREGRARLAPVGPEVYNRVTAGDVAYPDAREQLFPPEGEQWPTAQNFQSQALGAGATSATFRVAPGHDRLIISSDLAAALQATLGDETDRDAITVSIPAGETFDQFVPWVEHVSVKNTSAAATNVTVTAHYPVRQPLRA